MLQAQVPVQAGARGAAGSRSAGSPGPRRPRRPRARVSAPDRAWRGSCRGLSATPCIFPWRPLGGTPTDIRPETATRTSEKASSAAACGTGTAGGLGDRGSCSDRSRFARCCRHCCWRRCSQWHHARRGAVPGQGLRERRRRAAQRDAHELAVAAQCLLNNERSKRGMVRLKMNRQAPGRGHEHNDDMVENRYFQHDSPQRRNVVDRVLGDGLPQARRQAGCSARTSPGARISAHAAQDRPAPG